MNEEVILSLIFNFIFLHYIMNVHNSFIYISYAIDTDREIAVSCSLIMLI